MKKILSSVILLALVSSSNAATLNWTGLNIYKPGSTTEKLDGGAVYLFITEQSSNFGAGVTTISDVKTLLEKSGTEVVKNDDQKVVGIKNGETTIDVAAAGASNSSGGFSGATGYNGTSFTGGNSLKAFAVILDAADFANAKNYMVTEERSASWTSSNGFKTLAFGSQANNTWTPVPEPSTAVLALAGLALLLKRRRA